MSAATIDQLTDELDAALRVARQDSQRYARALDRRITSGGALT